MDLIAELTLLNLVDHLSRVQQLAFFWFHTLIGRWVELLAAVTGQSPFLDAEAVLAAVETCFFNLASETDCRPLTLRHDELTGIRTCFRCGITSIFGSGGVQLCM